VSFTAVLASRSSFETLPVCVGGSLAGPPVKACDPGRQGCGVASPVEFVSAAPADPALSGISPELGAPAPDVASDTCGSEARGAAASAVAVSGGTPFGFSAAAGALVSAVGDEAGGDVSAAVVAMDGASLGLSAPAADFVSDASSEAGGAVSRADVAPCGAPSGVGVPTDFGAWLRLSKRASTCSCNLEHFNSSSKRTASSREGLA
jgi:hypothetical protein